MFPQKTLNQFLHPPREAILLSRLCLLKPSLYSGGGPGETPSSLMSLWMGKGRVAEFPRCLGEAPNSLFKAKVKQSPSRRKDQGECSHTRFTWASVKNARSTLLASPSVSVWMSWRNLTHKCTPYHTGEHDTTITYVNRVWKFLLRSLSGP